MGVRLRSRLKMHCSIYKGESARDGNNDAPVAPARNEALSVIEK